MTRNLSIFSLFLICILLFASCRKQVPQLPSNKGNVPDKNVADLLEINKVLATKEDSILKQYVLHESTDYRRNDLGFWYKIDRATSGSLLKDKDTCRLSCKMMLLNGNVLQLFDKQVIVGKKQLVLGLDAGLKLLHRGETASFIMPWYLAYGMKGFDSIVPPYTSLLFQLKLNS